MRRINNLSKKVKKNKTGIILCVTLLTAGFGVLPDCQTRCMAAKENKEYISAIQENKRLVYAGTNTLESSKTLTFSKEGQTEQKQASLVKGDGYILYLPDGEWKQSGSCVWTAESNKQVKLWVKHFKNKKASYVKKKLAKNGYKVSKGNEMVKKQKKMIYKTRLNKFENDIWCVFYCCPAESEEGWGAEMLVISDTFEVMGL